MQVDRLVDVDQSHALTPSPGSDSRLSLRFGVSIGKVLTCLAVGLGLAGCGGGTKPNDCQDISASTVTKIESGLQHGMSLTDAVGVQVDTRFAFVSGHLHGPGLNGGDVATWATDSLQDPTLIYAADGFSKQFSEWGSLAHSYAYYDGGQESRDCVG